MRQISKASDGLHDAAYDMAMVLGQLIQALDGEEGLRRYRVNGLDALKAYAKARREWIEAMKAEYARQPFPGVYGPDQGLAPEGR